MSLSSIPMVIFLFRFFFFVCLVLFLLDLITLKPPYRGHPL